MVTLEDTVLAAPPLDTAGAPTDVMQPRGTLDDEEATTARSQRVTGSIFSEDLVHGAPYPSLEELERAGVFLSTSQRIAEWKLERGPLPSEPVPLRASTMPSNLPTINTLPSSPPPDSPSPERRRSLASPSPASPPLESARPSSPTTTRLSPLGLIRKATRTRPPPSPRTQSTSDLPGRPPLPLVSPMLYETVQSPWEAAFSSSPTPSKRPTSPVPPTTTNGAPRAPRKLVRHSVPQPITTTSSRSIPTINTNTALLSAPSSSSHFVESPSAISPSSPSTKRTWRSSMPSFRSSSSSRGDNDEEKSNDLRRRRSPSPADAFPTSVRREAALPPVDSSTKRHGKKRGSSVSSSEDYLGDGEGSKSSGSIWRMGRGHNGGGSKRATSPRGMSTSKSDWSLLDVDPEDDYQPRRSFEVVRRPLVGRSQSDNVLEAERLGRELVVGLNTTASTSSPNLTKIEEDPEDPLRITSPLATSTSPRSRTRTTSSNSLIGSSRAPSPTPGASATSSLTILVHDPSSTSSPPPLPTSISTSFSLFHQQQDAGIIHPTPELVRSTGMNPLRHDPSESDLSSITSSWDASEDDTPASSTELDEDDEDEGTSDDCDSPCVKEIEVGKIQVEVEGEGVGLMAL